MYRVTVAFDYSYDADRTVERIGELVGWNPEASEWKPVVMFTGPGCQVVNVIIETPCMAVAERLKLLLESTGEFTVVIGEVEECLKI